MPNTNHPCYYAYLPVKVYYKYFLMAYIHIAIIVNPLSLYEPNNGRDNYVRNNHILDSFTFTIKGIRQQ